MRSPEAGAAGAADAPVRPSEDRVLHASGGPQPVRSVPTPLDPAQAEVARQMQICNACRYCESYCAVFPAMTRRLEFASADVDYLANLCHNCGACYHACQYAPPHEFAVNVPRALAEVRVGTYERYAWPRAFGALYRSNGVAVALALAAGLALFLVLALLRNGTLLHEPLAGNFYAVFPHDLMAKLFGAVSLGVVLAFAVGAARFWRDVSPGRATAPAAAEAARHSLALTYLSRHSIVAPAGTPPAVLDRLARAFGAALASPEVRQRLAGKAASLAGADFGRYVAREVATWAKAGKSSGATAEQGGCAVSLQPAAGAQPAVSQPCRWRSTIACSASIQRGSSFRQAM